MPNGPLSGPIEAVIFDMDGLLIDSEAIYLRAMQTAARAVGRDMSLEFCHSMVGVPGHECNLMIQELYGADFDLKEFRVHVSAHVRQSMDERVPIKPGVVELLDFLAGRDLPRAVASSAQRAAKRMPRPDCPAWISSGCPCGERGTLNGPRERKYLPV